LKILILGGAGFVGLNIAQAALAGHSVTVFDRLAVPESASRLFAAGPGRFEAVIGDVTDPSALRDAIHDGVDTLVLGAAITADAARDAADPGTILQVNLMSQIAALEAARDAGVGRVVNLSSAAAYGRTAEHEAELTETMPANPIGLYALTKFASERVAARLGDLWGLDVVSLRLSAVFGPWERSTGVRDTLSPQIQIAKLAQVRQPALLERPGRRDWIYAPDVADAVLRVIAAPRLRSRLFNVSQPQPWSVLEWGRLLAARFPGFVCRLAQPGETPTISLHGPVDRAPLATGLLGRELGWHSRFGLAESAEDFADWCCRHGSEPIG
jgi:UDP-glucose 4-epimerase